MKPCPGTTEECSLLGSDAAVWKTTNPGSILSFPSVTLLDQCKRTMTRCGSFSVSSWSRSTAVAWPSPSPLSSLPTYSWWWGNASSAAVRKKAKSHRFVVSWIFPCCPSHLCCWCIAVPAWHPVLIAGILCWEISKTSVMQIHCAAGNLFSKIQVFKWDISSALLPKLFQCRIALCV